MTDEIYWGHPSGHMDWFYVPHYAKVVNRKRYDTRTAALICDNTEFQTIGYPGVSSLEFLFQTEKGNYFKVIASFNGFRDYSVQRAYRVSIFPLNKESAINFAEKYADADTVMLMDMNIEEA